VKGSSKLLTRPRYAPAALAVLLAASSLGLQACSRGGVDAQVSGEARSLNAAQVDLMLKTLAQAPSHGFQPTAFAAPGLAERARNGGQAGKAEVRRAILEYARAMHGHAIPKARFKADWGLRAAPYDAEAAFEKAAQAGELEAWLKSLPPQLPQYEALRAVYARYGELARSGGWRALPFDTDLKPGAKGADVAALRARLAAEDADTPKAPQGQDVFDAGLVEAVKRAQVRYGQMPTGVVDAGTRAALNTPVETRLAQIRANLERLRWLPRELPATRIEANSAAGQVDVYRDGRPVLSMLAAAGKPGDETPMLASKVSQVVLNPTWNVPDGIAQDELLPKGDAYLQSHGFVRNPEGEGVMLTQQPGPGNALGQVKFLFDNPYAVYLHDTPAKAAFTREQRSVSHGCVRLAQARDLARLLLASEPGWSDARIDEVLARDETTAVTLKTPVPVFIGYDTAFVTADGVAFRPDVYGWDAEVLRRLDAGKSSAA
jgi:murein L,D-transpeptidase YcbB/YkuD